MLAAADGHAGGDPTSDVRTRRPRWARRPGSPCDRCGNPESPNPDRLPRPAARESGFTATARADQAEHGYVIDRVRVGRCIARDPALHGRASSWTAWALASPCSTSPTQQSGVLAVDGLGDRTERASQAQPVGDDLGRVLAALRSPTRLDDLPPDGRGRGRAYRTRSCRPSSRRRSLRPVRQHRSLSCRQRTPRPNPASHACRPSTRPGCEAWPDAT